MHTTFKIDHVIVNINDLAVVELTDYGNGILRKSGKAYDPLRMAEDHHHCLKFSLWELASIFGPYFFNGCQQVFVNNEIKLIKFP